MNKSIFRAWDKRLNILTMPFSLFDIGLAGVIKNQKTDGSFCYLEDCSIMQFTGLNDKNGKMIYEGDYLKYTKHEGYRIPSCFMFVVYDPEKACFSYHSNMYHAELTKPFSYHDELKTDILNHCEVIGNCYENKELHEKMFEKIID